MKRRLEAGRRAASKIARSFPGNLTPDLARMRQFWEHVVEVLSAMLED